MGIFDRARDALAEHGETVDPVVDRLADEADRRTGGKRGATIERGAELVKDKLRDPARRDSTTEPGQPT